VPADVDLHVAGDLGDWQIDQAGARGRLSDVQGSVWCPEAPVRSNLYMKGAGIVMNPPRQ
jgi:hypothetical protein